MSGTGTVAIGGASVYAHYAHDGRRTRLRVPAGDPARLGLRPGRPVRLGLPGVLAANALVTAVVTEPPFAWVEAEASAPTCG